MRILGVQDAFLGCPLRVVYFRACFARVRVPGCSNCLPSFDKTWMSARRRLLGGLGFRIFTSRRETFRSSRFSGLLVACRMSQCRRRQAEQKSSGQEIRNLGVENQKSRKDSKPQTRCQIDSEKSKHRQRHTDTQTHTHTRTHTHSLSLRNFGQNHTKVYLLDTFVHHQHPQLSLRFLRREAAEALPEFSNRSTNARFLMRPHVAAPHGGTCSELEHVVTQDRNRRTERSAHNMRRPPCLKSPGPTRPIPQQCLL